MYDLVLYLQHIKSDCIDSRALVSTWCGHFVREIETIKENKTRVKVSS